MAYRKDDFQALNEINSDIQNKSFRHVYLLYGDEDYLVRQFASRLKEAIVGDDEMNYTAVSGSTATIDDILSTAGTLPFFADRRLIVMDECGFFKKSQPQILALVQKCPDYLYLIFTEKSVEASSKLYKVVDKCGLAAKMSTPSEGTLRQWAQKQFREAGKSIEPSAVSLLIEMTGSTMGLLKEKSEAGAQLLPGNAHAECERGIYPEPHGSSVYRNPGSDGREKVRCIDGQTGKAAEGSAVSDPQVYGAGGQFQRGQS